jgi:hypothetical protein
MTPLTREQINFIQTDPVCKAFAEGKTIECKYGHGWSVVTLLNDWVETCGVTNNPCRIKPEPKLRPWKPEEVPVGALIRAKLRDSEHNRYLLSGVNGYHVIAGRGMYESVEEVFNSHEHSLDHGKTWQPCGVME